MWYGRWGWVRHIGISWGYGSNAWSAEWRLQYDCCWWTTRFNMSSDRGNCPPPLPPLHPHLPHRGLYLLVVLPKNDVTNTMPSREMYGGGGDKTHQPSDPLCAPLHMWHNFDTRGAKPNLPRFLKCNMFLLQQALNGQYP